MQIWRGNSYAEIHGAPGDFLATVSRHLAVPIEMGTKHGIRFGSTFKHHGQLWGSLLTENRVPGGLTAHVVALAKHYKIRGLIRDIRTIPPDGYPWYASKVRPRPYQEAVHKQILRHGVGVVDAPPRSGKTLMALRAVDHFAHPTLYLAPSLPIVKQTYLIFCKVFGEDFVARLDGSAKPSEKDISKPIVIATAASAVKQSQEWYDTRDLLIVDEFHHAAAETYHLINALATNIYYRVCLTGTHFRTGEDKLAMEAICSKVIYSIPIDYLVSNGYLAPPYVQFRTVASGPTSTSQRWETLYQKVIVENEPRNALAAETAAGLAHHGIPTIVLVRRRVHADELAERIPGAVAVKGGENALTGRTIEAFRSGEIPVVVGTTVIGEGVDLPNAGALVYASGGNEGVQMMQSYFRPLTANPGKQYGLIYDFRDIFHATMHKQSAQRFGFIRDRLGEGRVRIV